MYVFLRVCFVVVMVVLKVVDILLKYILYLNSVVGT